MLVPVPEQGAEPGGTAMDTTNKPSDVIANQLRAAPTLQQHKALKWCKLRRDSDISQASRTTATAQSGRADVKGKSQSYKLVMTVP